MAYQVSPGSGNCGLNDSWKCRTVDSVGDVGKYTSIDVAYVVNETFPAHSFTKVGISYYDVSNGALKYALYRSDRSEIEVQTIDQPINQLVSSFGKFSSFKFDPETQYPVISYYAHNWYSDDVGYAALKLASYVGSGGTGCNNSIGGEWTCEIIHKDTGEYWQSNMTGSHTSLDFNYLGRLYVAFHNQYLGELYYAYRDSGGSCWNTNWACVVVDGSTPGNDVDKGYSISLHAQKSPTDRMRIAYWIPGAHKLRYAVRTLTGSEGNCKNEAFNCISVQDVTMPEYDTWESDDSLGYSEISITVDEYRQPIIAYSNGYDLMIARPASVYGLSEGNCGDPLPGGSEPYFYCKVLHSRLDSDGALGQFVSVSVNKAGLAMVAYSEDIFGTDPDEQYLLVKYQLFETYLPLINH